MAATSAVLLQLLAVKEQINYYTAQQIFYTNKYDSNKKVLTEVSKRTTGWEEKQSDGENKLNEHSSDKNYELKGAGGCVCSTVEQYANSFAYKTSCCDDSSLYDEDMDLQVELEYLDMEYDAQKTLMNTMLEELKASEEKLEQQVSEDAQDTGLLGQ